MLCLLIYISPKLDWDLCFTFVNNIIPPSLVLSIVVFPYSNTAKSVTVCKGDSRFEKKKRKETRQQYLCTWKKLPPFKYLELFFNAPSGKKQSKMQKVFGPDDSSLVWCSCKYLNMLSDPDVGIKQPWLQNTAVYIAGETGACGSW